MARNSVLWAVIGCALLLHGVFLAQRWALERANDTVEIALDYEAVGMVAEQSGIPASELLERWSALGVTSVALGGFVDEGSADEEPAGEGPTDEESAGERPGDGGPFDEGPSRDGDRFPDPLEVAARDRGLVAEAAGSIGRVAPRSLAAAEAAEARGLALGAYIPRGETVEGYPDDVAGTARVLAELGLPVGVVEFVDARGRSELIRTLDYDVVFVHSIPPREFARLTDEGAVRRLYRAAFERQARLLYLHLRFAPDPGAAFGGSFASATGAVSSPISPSDEGGPPVGSPELAERNTRYIQQVAQMLTGAGLRIGPATRAPRWRTPGFIALAAALAAGAAAALVAGRFVASSEGWSEGPAKRAVQRLRSPFVVGGLLAGPPFAATLLMALGRDVVARQGVALAVAVAFPLLAVGTGAGIVGVYPFAPSGQRLRPRGVGRGLSALPVVFAIGVAGAALVAGTLGDVRFMTKLELFRGVKMAHAVPLALLIGWWLAGTVFSPGRGKSHPERSAEEAAATGEYVGPVLHRMPWRTVAVALLVLAAGYVLVARTGHTVLPVSAAERAMREWLEGSLPVRPRTKEFLLGYPALVVGLWLASRGAGGSAETGADGEQVPDLVSPAWAGPFLVAGAVVPISIINTFAHVHISLAVSAVRTVFGLLTGSVVGLAAAGGIALLLRALARHRRLGNRW